MNYDKLGELHNKLLENIKAKMPELKALLESINGHWEYEDLIYRFYHGSFKVYYIQGATQKIVEMLKSLAPEGTTVNSEFQLIYDEGTGKKFRSSHNRAWLKHTRPQLEAFFHAKYFLEMCVKYGQELEKAPDCLPSGWAGALYFYGLR